MENHATSNTHMFSAGAKNKEVDINVETPQMSDTVDTAFHFYGEQACQIGHVLLQSNFRGTVSVYTNGLW